MLPWLQVVHDWRTSSRQCAVCSAASGCVECMHVCNAAIFGKQHAVGHGRQEAIVVNSLLQNCWLGGAARLYANCRPWSVFGPCSQLLRRDGEIEKLASLATNHKCVTILFADVIGFTEMCRQVSDDPCTMRGVKLATTTCSTTP